MYVDLPCSMCGAPSGPEDEDSILDGGGIICGMCVARMGIPSLILSCGLCKFPAFDSIPIGDMEYCRHCAQIIRKMGLSEEDEWYKQSLSM